MTGFALLCDGHERNVDLDGFGPTAGDFEAATGWRVEERGLCRGDACIPAPVEHLRVGDRIDIAAAATAMRRPWVVEPAARVGVLGEAAADRSAQLASLHAPQFALPDLAGTTHRLSDFRGRKVLLAAYASW